VVSQPARPVGRGRRVQDPPVAARARERGLPVVQPERPSLRRFRESIAEIRPDLGVVVAYGAILTRQLLDVPPLGFVNVHASLLPKYRGAAPIQAAIAAGDAETGVTTMQVGPGLDSGPMLLERRLTIGSDETTGELTPRLADTGADLLLETIERLEQGDLVPRPQTDADATYAGRIDKRDGRVDWTDSATDLVNRLRAFTPWPGLTAPIAGEAVKLMKLSRVEPGDWAADGASPAAPGTVLGLVGDALVIACGFGTAVALEQAQRPGRGVVSGGELSRALDLV